MDHPELRLFSRSAGTSKALVFIDGFLSENKDRRNNLLSALNYAGWHHSIYHLWWEASSKSSAFGMDYHKCKIRAKSIGKEYLQSLIESEITEQNISLLAHSLGARVAFDGIDNWKGNQHSIENVIFLSGAVRRDSSKNWGYVADKIKGKLINVYSYDDSTLKKWFKIAELGNACGRKPIKEYHPKIINEDATYFLGKDHNLSKPLEYLPELVRKGLWCM
ncbi:DUF726 domain-containing protein [Brunnivagina elsteri]|uniref:DUF726 domain-containing protein n=1 Tax=Brunnivagina elsteri CCALA 953 TaxID=987040 RepID=A0A2A2TME8_9CYAN|nr:DUF726 domain-containing protein [Calothrix elsteri]PAX59669.1 hypothetical protein CK510_05915 [Calothrix elsteri CCALA 953]